MFGFDLNLILLPLVAFCSLLVIFFGLWLFFRSFKQKGILTRSLNMGLLTISLPALEETKGGEQRNKKEFIGVMEQVFSSFANLQEKGSQKLFYPRPYLVLEMATPRQSQELIFYLSASRQQLALVKKIIYGFYPDAQIEETSDYNIFGKEGVTVGSFLGLKKDFSLPISTHRGLETDPLNEITNTLAKLEEGGEGAAFQIVFQPARSGWTARARKILQEMERGKSFAAAKAEVSKGGITKLFSSPKKSEPNQPPAPASSVVSLADRKMIEAIHNKISKPGFECNLRLLASAASQVEAEQILAQLESAFAQFENPESNGFKVNRSRGRALNRLIYEYSFRLFNFSRKVILNTEELSSVFHFSVGGTKSPRLKTLKARLAAPPANLPKEGVILGKNSYRGVETTVRLDLVDRRRHLYVVGQTGTGKSFFLQEMARQDMEAGHGLAVVDPHGDLIEKLLGLVPASRMQDVIYFNPGDLEFPLGLNMLEYDPKYPEQKTFIVNEMINIFDKLYDLRQTGGPMFEQYMRNALLLLMDDPAQQATLMDVPRIFADATFRAGLLAKCQNQVTKDFWEKEAEKAGGEAALQNVTPYVTSKFNTFVANDYMRPIISQPQSAFNFRQVMDEGKILLINLSKGRLGELNSNLLGMILVGKLTMAALSRADLGEEQRRDFFVYIDEFQNVTTDSISVILSEARKYRLDLVVAHQYIKQLTEKNRDAVFGNVGSMCAFRVGAEDAEILAKHFEPVFSASDLMGLDNRRAYVKLLVNGATTPPFNIETLEAQAGNPQLAEQVKKLSRTKYRK